MTNAHSTSINPSKQQPVKIGSVFKTNEGSRLTVTEYINSKKVLISFNDKYAHSVFTTSNTIRNGGIKNPYHPSVCGVGYFGVGKFKATNNGKKTKIYTSWHFMIQRCYTDKPRYSNYKDCTVCDEWLNFQTYAIWAESNGLINGFEVDKDLLVKGNRVYSPSTCVVVPHEVNVVILGANGNRGDLPIGVDFNKNKYRVRLNKDGVLVEIGYFDDVDTAFMAYKHEKEIYIKEVADRWRSVISRRAYQALIDWRVGIDD